LNISREGEIDAASRLEKVLLPLCSSLSAQKQIPAFLGRPLPCKLQQAGPGH